MEATQSVVSVNDSMPVVTTELVDEQGVPVTGYVEGNAYVKYKVDSPNKIASIRMYKMKDLTVTDNSVYDSATTGIGDATCTGRFPDMVHENGYYKIEVVDESGYIGYDIIWILSISAG